MDESIGSQAPRSASSAGEHSPGGYDAWLTGPSARSAVPAVDADFGHRAGNISYSGHEGFEDVSGDLDPYHLDAPSADRVAASPGGGFFTAPGIPYERPGAALDEGRRGRAHQHPGHEHQLLPSARGQVPPSARGQHPPAHGQHAGAHAQQHSASAHAHAQHAQHPGAHTQQHPGAHAQYPGAHAEQYPAPHAQQHPGGHAQQPGPGVQRSGGRGRADDGARRAGARARRAGRREVVEAGAEPHREPSEPEAFVPGDQVTDLLFWVYRQPKLFPLVSDLAIWPVGLVAGAILKLVVSTGDAWLPLLVSAVVAIALQAGIGIAVGLYRQRWRVTSFPEMSALGLVWAITSAVLIIGNFSARNLGSPLPTSAVITGCLATLGILGVERIVWRRYWEANRRPDPLFCKPTIVLGAGEGGSQMIRAMLLDPDSDYYPVALLDDDPNKRHREVHGVKVRGTTDDLEFVAQATRAEVLLIAVSNASSELISRASKRATAIGLQVRVLPAASELVGKMTLADVRPPTVDDLLGRDPVEIDLEAVSGYIRGRRVLVTGAGGSIGSELAKQIYEFEPEQLYLLDRDENALHSVQLELEGRALLDTDMLVVADIRDRDRMFELFNRYQPHVVFHAAALKHLTLLENHPAEAVKTNALGTKNILDAAVNVGVERFVNVSTDKAADPTSMLGASKLAAEKLTALIAAQTGLPYVSVRFGNVLGSRGSVLPTFLRQIERGQPVTVTHPEVTRYFMTIPEAVRLVVQAGAIGEAGEVMVLDMGQPVKIVDLAKQLIETLRPGTPIEYTGLRPGEKLHEALLSDREVGVARHHPRIMHTKAQLVDPSGLLARKSGVDERELRRMLGIRLRGRANDLQEAVR